MVKAELMKVREFLERDFERIDRDATLSTLTGKLRKKGYPGGRCPGWKEAGRGHKLRYTDEEGKPAHECKGGPSHGKPPHT